mmetsp:Transcript_7291/g.13992  ORF Transcript_7291/g.13992 Transcript_7291/m.13992 type:complete len:121 (+) Transcript_7291:162-524(+)
MTSMIAVYRMGIKWFATSLLPWLDDNVWHPSKQPSTVPTLQMFGHRDAYVDPAMAGASMHPDYVTFSLSRTHVYQASHWLPDEKRALCIRHIEQFLDSLPPELPSAFTDEDKDEAFYMGD